MSLLDLNPATLGPSLATYAIVGAVCLAVGGFGGYKAGSAIMYQQEDKKVDACVDTITQAEHETLDKLRSGQAVLTAVISDTAGKTSDSEAARAKVLADASISDAARKKLLSGELTAKKTPPDTRPAVPKQGATTPASEPGPASVASTCPEPSVEYVVPQATIHVINQLLEISNETGLYSIPLPASVPTPDGLPEQSGAQTP